MYRFECEVAFTLVDEAAEEVRFAYDNALFLKVVMQIAKTLLRERILLIGERSLFCLCRPELVDKVIQHRAIVFLDKLVLFKQHRVLSPDPEHPRDSNQPDENTETRTNFQGDATIHNERAPQPMMVKPTRPLTRSGLSSHHSLRSFARARDRRGSRIKAIKQFSALDYCHRGACDKARRYFL